MQAAIGRRTAIGAGKRLLHAIPSRSAVLLCSPRPLSSSSLRLYASRPTDVAKQQFHSKAEEEGSSSFAYLSSLLAFLGLSLSLPFLPSIHAAEGDSAKQSMELDLPSEKGEMEGMESEQFKHNEEGEIEWMSTSKRPRIVVLGTGWGSVSFLKHLDINNYEIVVISPRNYFLFTPLLPSACTGTLEMGSLTEPIRQILLQRHQTHQNQYVEGKAIGLDREKRKVVCVDSNGRQFMVEYDHLLIGVGANNNTFNTPGVKDFAFFLKEAKHARIIRKEILEHFERASSPTTSIEEKQKLLQFVIVGGGPTGVEFAGELVDFLDSDLKKQFPSLIPFVKVRLLQSQEHILNTYDEAISRYAEEKFRQLRIEVITGARVKAITVDSLSYEEKATQKKVTIPFGLCLWSTGIEMNDFTRGISQTIPGQEHGKALVTDEYLRLLREIPQLDRVPKRIVQEAVQAIKGETAATATAATATSAPVPSKSSSSSSSKPSAEFTASVAQAVSSSSDSVISPSSLNLSDCGISQSSRDLNVDPRIYVVGDCSTTFVPKLAKRMRRIFEAADVNGDGKLSYEELRNLCASLSETFPVMSAQMSMIMNQYMKYTSTDAMLELGEFEKMLLDADKNARVYPATAQVASQQGKWLARRFNMYAKAQIKAGKMSNVGGRDHWELEQRLVKQGVYHRTVHPPIAPADDDPNDAARKPFRYKHLGSLAYIGGETAAIDLGKGGSYTGSAAFWLWKSAYLSEAVSTRTRLNLAWDW
jgi:NADH dehydrogenase FAD-containing subunit